MISRHIKHIFDEVSWRARQLLQNLQQLRVDSKTYQVQYFNLWISKLDDLLALSDRDILRHAGRVSHDDAVAKAELEYDRFAGARAASPSLVERQFEDAVREVKQLETARRGSKHKDDAAKGRRKS